MGVSQALATESGVPTSVCFDGVTVSGNEGEPCDSVIGFGLGVGSRHHLPPTYQPMIGRGGVSSDVLRLAAVSCKD